MNGPTPGQLRYIALLTIQLGLPEPHITTFDQAREEIAALLAEKRKRQVLKTDDLSHAIYNTLAWEGKSMSYIDITKIFKEKYPWLRATESVVLARLQGKKDLFARITADRYFLKGKVEGQHYPLI
jgi:hypothetical protein